MKFSEIVRGAAYLNSLSVLVFLRCRFGERVTGDLFVAGGFSWFCYWTYKTTRESILLSLPPSTCSLWFLYPMTGLIFSQQLGVWLRRSQPAETHSYSMGECFPYWRALGHRDATIHRYLQPASCLLFALGLRYFDSALACWIGTAAIGLFFQEQSLRISAKTKILDTIDGRIESRAHQDAVQERLSASARGAIEAAPIVRSAQAAKTASPNVGNISQHLDPELRKLLEHPFQDPPETSQ